MVLVTGSQWHSFANVNSSTSRNCRRLATVFRRTSSGEHFYLSLVTLCSSVCQISIYIMCVDLCSGRSRSKNNKSWHATSVFWHWILRNSNCEHIRHRLTKNELQCGYRPMRYQLRYIIIQPSFSLQIQKIYDNIISRVFDVFEMGSAWVSTMSGNASKVNAAL